jgi:hypothetical protein
MQGNNSRNKLFFTQNHNGTKDYFISPFRISEILFFINCVYVPMDRFHIMTHLSKVIDKVRAEEARELKAASYEPVLTKIRWLLRVYRPQHHDVIMDI